MCVWAAGPSTPTGVTAAVLRNIRRCYGRVCVPSEAGILKSNPNVFVLRGGTLEEPLDDEGSSLKNKICLVQDA